MDEPGPTADSPPPAQPGGPLPHLTTPSSNGVHDLFLGPEGLRPGWSVFLYLGMGVLVFLLLSSLGRFIPPGGAAALWQSFYSYVALVIAALAPAGVMAVIEKRPFAAYGLPWRGFFSSSFWLGLTWGIVALSGLMLLMRGAGVFSFGTLALHGMRAFRFAAFWGAYFLLVGFFEEFTFRGYTQFTLARGMGFWPAALTLSFVFGAIHLQNPGEAWVGALCAGFIGLFFCFTLRRTGSLWFAVGMHATWDWGESYLYSVPDSGGMATGHLLNSSFHGPRWLTGGSVGPEGSVLVFVVIGASWWLFDRVYPKSRGEETHHE
ncbi:MAG: lysostaphin resistance A-like protein [Terriglobales bacterium]